MFQDGRDSSSQSFRVPGSPILFLCIAQHGPQTHGYGVPATGGDQGLGRKPGLENKAPAGRGALCFHSQPTGENLAMWPHLTGVG